MRLNRNPNRSRIMTRELRSFRSLEAQLRVERRLDGVLERLRPLRTYGRARGRRVLLLLQVLALQAPDLLDHPNAVSALCAEVPLRSPQSFRGSGVEDLVRHLLVGVRYPLPGFLLKLFADPDGPCAAAVRALAVLGTGGAMSDLRGQLPATFTRRMGHALWLIDEADSWMHAVRTAQVTILGGPASLADQLMETRLRHRLHDAQYVHDLLVWLIREGPFTDDDLVLAIDHAWWRRCVGQPVSWAMGRRRLLEEARARAAAGIRHGDTRRLPEAPFADQDFYARTRRWTVRQLRTSFELYVEGRVLRHCVATYVDDARAGKCWLFGLRRNGRRKVTLEVTPDGRLVQATGLCNRMPTSDEAVAIHRWAKQVGVEVAALPGLVR